MEDLLTLQFSEAEGHILMQVLVASRLLTSVFTRKTCRSVFCGSTGFNLKSRSRSIHV